MHTFLINAVAHLFDMSNAKCEFLQVGTYFVLPQGLKDLSNVLKVFFPTLAKDGDAI